MSDEEKNKALVRKFFEEAWVKGNVAAIDEFMATDYVEHPVPSGLPPGPEGVKQMITTYHTAFPDVKPTIEDIFAEGQMVAFRWSVSGTHLGEWLGIPRPVTTCRQPASASTGSLGGRWSRTGPVSSR